MSESRYAPIEHDNRPLGDVEIIDPELEEQRAREVARESMNRKWMSSNNPFLFDGPIDEDEAAEFLYLLPDDALVSLDDDDDGDDDDDDESRMNHDRGLRE